MKTETEITRLTELAARAEQSGDIETAGICRRAVADLEDGLTASANIEQARDRLAADEDAGNAEAVTPTTARCACGEWSGERCDYIGPKESLVTVEWMPDDLRASHMAAGCRGVYPLNGAVRLRVSAECADLMLANDGEWTERISE